AAVAVYLVGVFILAITKYISLTSLAMALLFPILLLILSHRPETIIIAAIMTALVFILHRGNIQRLFNGTERKLVIRA
ncbi:MAG: glycerol-3-phosphate acyltransferase, partial [Defluviitaleaceae bacterium]|nr:glycerol-3-phosphate acyltransferase [Defluviitaleaceae bacterium]